MDDIDERIVYRQLVESMLAKLGLQGDAREEAFAALWQERAALTRWLVLGDDTDASASRAAGRPAGH